MELFYFKSEKGNFGDDLNPWLWGEIFGDLSKYQCDIDFIGIGVLKAATTNIAEILHEHPQICISVPKEVRYFNTLFRCTYLKEHKKVVKSIFTF